MRLEQAFSLIRDLEEQVFPSDLMWRSINVWPLMRQCLWLELISATEPVKKMHPVNRADAIQQRILNRATSSVRAFRNRPASIGSETTAFISRPVYLQELPNGKLFDRVVDPLMSCMPGDSLNAKYYVAPWPEQLQLSFSAALLRPFNLLTSFPGLPQAHRASLTCLARDAGIEPNQLLWRYERSLRAFDHWLQAARRFLDSRKKLKTIYLTSWYFSDMMALVAAARERCIKTIEVQHGKQGKFQAMYSGWRIPEEGYQMMPDVFWNWGEPSAEHILASSPNRLIHRPIIGGFPWLDYFCQHVSKHNVANHIKTGKRVLVTTQEPQGDNNQSIPDFFLEFLRENPSDISFIFRCHPNDRRGAEYCRYRLSELPTEIYTIDDGSSNLYDILISATHHITAYSSCCYEANAFGVPTLLFGADARAIYSDEIESGLFSWALGSAKDLASWLESGSSDKDMTDRRYIRSSLENTAAILRNAEFGHFEYHAI